MRLITKYMTNNDCYKQNKKHTVKGIMVHSTATPGVMAAEWYDRWNKPGIDKAVHAFVDNEAVYQYLPWDIAGWHSGTGSKGKSQNANNTGYIGFEICEPSGHTYSFGTMINYNVDKNAAYFRAIWENAVDLCVMLCEKYGLNETNIITHCEGHQLGIASNHSDVMQWFPKHGQSMDTFRAAVKKKLNREDGESMETYKMAQDMNFRKSPNGTKIDLIPKGTQLMGNVSYSGSVGWLYTEYNNKSGCVAVLPESRGYAVKINAPTEDDYKSLYEKTLAELNQTKDAYNELQNKMAKIHELSGEAK